MHRHASLNRIFRLVWSHVHQTWVVVSETSRGRGKRASRKLLLAAAALAAAHLAQAGPTGGQVTAGNGSITQSANTTTVNQSSQNLSLLWQSFNTGDSETVNFVQPSASAIAVNRIVDTNATQFFGKLNANGQVYLINPNGVLFGAGAQVNVGGLVASTLDIDDQALGGAARRFSGTGTGSIVNRGEIATSEGGYVAFIGNRVSNAGTIGAAAGSVALGAGSDVTLSFAGNSLVKMRVDQGTLDNLADNGGLIRADGGTVLLSAGAKDAVLASMVNNTGVIEARSVREVNGTIVLDGGQHSTVSNSGTLDASGRNAGQTGGSVKLLGQDVALTTGGRVDVAGDAGGGTALIGGNFLGAGPEHNAQNTTVASGAGVDADAIASGTGGRVAVWSDGETRFAGRISARGGAAGGDGGAVETSGKQLVIGADGAVNTLAPRGTAGDWLLDPQDFTIGGFEPGDSDIDGAQITAALQSSNVTIKTGPGVACTNVSCSEGQPGNGDIILADGALVGGYDWTSGTTLTLSAHRNIDLRGTANIDTGNGDGHIVLRADNSGTGVGTVILSSDSNIFGSSNGTVKIYYNPSSYSTPTAYGAIQNSGGDPIIRAENLSTYMLVNLRADIASKTYDGTNAASISAISSVTAAPSGISFDTSGAYASFANKNAGVNKTVSVGGVVLGGANAGQYAINGLDSSSATIHKANLAVSGVSANSKTYDGTVSVTLSGTASVAAIGSDSVSVAGSGAGSSFADKRAGAGKAVTVSGFTLTGADAGNYSLVMPAGLSATIHKANLAVSGVSANNKTYDGSTAATLAGSASVAAFGSDVVSVSGGTASFADKNAGSGKAVTVSGYTLTGADAGNYELVMPSGLSATISKANVAVSGVTANNKTYDGGTAATLGGSASVAAIGEDEVSVSGSGSATFADKNAGSGKAVTVSGYALTGADAGNYNLVQPSGLSATIHKADLAVSGVTANNKTYDGGAAATLAGSATVAAFGSDVVSVSGGMASFADKNAGAGKAVTVSGFTLTGADAGNYSLVMPAGLSATIHKANLAVSGVSANNKTYDGSTAATLAGSASVAAIGSDVVSVSGGTASFADKNAGAGKAVTVIGYALSGADAGNYNLVQPSGLSATIGKADLAVSGVTATNKTYDGSTTATLGGSASVAAFGNDVVNVSGGTASFADKNAGSGKAVTATGYTLSGADAGNYSLVQPSGLSATISKADLAVSGVSANSKTYDGSAAATLVGSASVAAFGSDVVSVSGGTASFADKNAGSGKAVTVSGYTLSGAGAGNYNLVMPAGLSATIHKASLAVSGVTANNKTYDGSTGATLAGSASVAAFGSDVVSVSGGTGSFADKNAGSGKAVTVSGYTLTGTDAGNYELVMPVGLSATISKADLAVSGMTANNKTYNGSTAATLAGSATVSAFGSDVVSVSGGTASFADKNAGSGKAVTATGYTLSGADAGNYNLVQPSGLSATISKADLAVSGVTANNKTYDGSAAATLAGSASVAAFGSDVVSVSCISSGTFADKHAGSGKLVTVSGFTLTGADAGNYNLVMPSGLSATIHKADLAVSGVSANNKTYDGSSAATLGGNATVAAFGSDVVNVSGGTASFADKNAGSGKAVAVSGYTLTGTDAGNYNLVMPTGLSATISKADLAVSGVTANNKTYDGSTAATLAGSASVAAFGSDVVSVSGGTASFADKHAGSGKGVTATGYTLSGADAGNYNLVQPSGLSATIHKAGLAVSGITANSKTYDGSTAATLAGSATVAAFGSDVVNVVGGAASFADKKAGAGKAVTVSGYTLTGADAGNYALVMPSGLSATVHKADLAVSGVSANNKTYDGSTAATLGGSASMTAFGSDVVNVSGGTASFADKNAGSGKAVTVSGYMLTGADAGNYNLVQPSGLSATISKADLAVSGVTANSKTYDGSVAATLSGTATVAGFGSDMVSVSGGTASFADKNVASGKAVTATGYTLSGADAGNYNLVMPSGLRAAITPARLVVSGIAASDKTFDGTTAAAVDTTAARLDGKIGTDIVTVSSNGAFSDAGAGTGKTVRLTNTFGGADIGNYQIVDQATALASIAALPQTPAVPAPPVAPPVTPVPPPVTPAVPPLAPVTPPTPVAVLPPPAAPAAPVAPTGQVRDSIAQVQSSVLSPQASAQPQALNLSSTLVVVDAGKDQPQDDKPRAEAANGLINTRLGAGPGAPTLRIQQGGVQLPPLALTTAE